MLGGRSRQAGIGLLRARARACVCQTRQKEREERKDVVRRTTKHYVQCYAVWRPTERERDQARFINLKTFVAATASAEMLDCIQIFFAWTRATIGKNMRQEPNSASQSPPPRGLDKAHYLDTRIRRLLPLPHVTPNKNRRHWKSNHDLSITPPRLKRGGESV